MAKATKKKTAKKPTKTKKSRSKSSKKNTELDHDELEMMLSIQSEEHAEEHARHRRWVMYAGLAVIFISIVFLFSSI